MAETETGTRLTRLERAAADAAARISRLERNFAALPGKAGQGDAPDADAQA